MDLLGPRHWKLLVELLFGEGGGASPEELERLVPSHVTLKMLADQNIMEQAGAVAELVQLAKDESEIERELASLAEQVAALAPALDYECSSPPAS